MAKRLKYACDFETTTARYSTEKASVWVAGFMEIGGSWKYGDFKSLEEFMNWARKGEKDLYFHNLKFDGQFITSWLLENDFRYSDNLEEPNTFNTMISNKGTWYGIRICNNIKVRKNGKREGKVEKVTTNIYCSLKKLPFSIDKIASDFDLNVKKVEVPEDFYDWDRVPGEHEMNELEREYLRGDVEVLAKALNIQFEAGMTGLTISQDAYKELKEAVGRRKFSALFPDLSLPMHKKLNKGYRGGFTWVNPLHQEKIISGGIVYDVNSLYPYIMRERELPYGNGVYYEGEYEDTGSGHNLYILCASFSFQIKEGKIPTIQLKRDPNFIGRSSEYLTSSDGHIVDKQVFTNVEWELIKEHYTLDMVTYHWGWKFKGVKGAFNAFIDKNYKIKRESKGSQKALAKLRLNSCYGKLGTNPDKTGKIPVLDDNGIVRYVAGDQNIDEVTNYLPAAMFITSWARDYTIRTAQAFGLDRVIYCDTDSLHLVGTDTPEWFKPMIDNDELGYWKFEYEFKKAKYLRQKTYMVEIEKENKVNTKITCAGMQEKVKKKTDPVTGLPLITLDTFKVGLELEGALKQKQVSGGCILFESTFIVKDHVFA